MTIVFVFSLITVFVAGAAYYFLILNRGNAFERAMVLADRGEYTDARGLIRSRISSNQDDYKAHFHMARIYAMEGNEENELLHLKEVKRINKFTSEMNAVNIMNRIGEIYYNSERYGESFENYLEVTNIAPNNEEALVYLAFMGAGQAEFKIAERFYTRLVEVAPNVADYHTARGVCLSMLRNQDAIKEMEMGLMLNPREQTARFLLAFQAYKDKDVGKAVEALESLMSEVEDPTIMHMSNRIGVPIYYLSKDYDKALHFAELCVQHAVSLGWEQEEYDARLTVSYMAMLAGDLDKASEHLLELEIRYPSDEKILRVSDFRMDMEEGVTTIDRVSPRGYDFFSNLSDWQRARFPENAIYKLSGLEMEEKFDILNYFNSEGMPTEQSSRTSSSMGDPTELIAKFNDLKGNGFVSACETMISQQGFFIDKTLPYRDKDGADYIARNKEDKKIRALFRIRQWTNQPISDIFLRDMQNYMNEQKVTQGFVIAGARLTPGAEAALGNLKKIKVINEYDLGALLSGVFQE